MRKHSEQLERGTGRNKAQLQLGGHRVRSTSLRRDSLWRDVRPPFSLENLYCEDSYVQANLAAANFSKAKI